MYHNVSFGRNKINGQNIIKLLAAIFRFDFKVWVNGIIIV